ncbi:MAG: hypothetical protein JW838_15860 [Spirochaetes bacterium]|nr:hypothetical protein [Spirochaetota bacterium]
MNCKWLFPMLCVTAGLMCAGDVSFKTKITYDYKGSKSEACHRYLYINRKPVPDAFSLMAHKDRTYIFMTRKYPWGDDGYMETDRKVAISDVDKKTTPEEQKRGWYCNGRNRLQGTPGTWIYVEWSGGAAFVDPEKLGELVQAERIKYIDRLDSYDKLK